MNACSMFRSSAEFVAGWSCAHMPTKCWGRYANVWVIRRLRGRAIRCGARDTALQTVVHYVGRLHHGGARSAAMRMLAAFERDAEKLNALLPQACEPAAAEARCTP